MDWERFRRLDNSTTIEILSAFASALRLENNAHEKNIEQMRASWRSSSSYSSNSTNPSVIDQLIEDFDPFFQSIIRRFGSKRLFSIITNISLNINLEKMATYLITAGEAITEKSKLYLNKQFPVYVDNQCTHYGNLAALLLSYADEAHNLIRRLSKIQHRSMAKMPESIAATYSNNAKITDIEIAKYLGYKSLGSTTLAVEAKLHLSSVTSIVMDYIIITGGLCERLLEVGIAVPEQVQHSLNWLHSETERLNRFGTLSNAEPKAEELRRQNLISAVYIIVTIIENTLDDILVSLKASSNYEDSPKTPVIISSELSYFTTTLIDKGISPMRAEEIAENLCDYCQKQQVQPRKLLPAEGKKIAADWPPEASDIFEETHRIHQDPTADQNRIKKKESWDKTLKLIEFFSTSTQRTLLLILFASLLYCCGIKTSPRSQVEDIRPEIPFKTELKDRFLSKKIDRRLLRREKRSNKKKNL